MGGTERLGINIGLKYKLYSYMKKHYSLLLAFLVAFSSFFVSCNENENGGSDSTICKITVVSDGDGIVSITNYIGTSVNVLIGNNVEVVATPGSGSKFIGWYISNSNEPVSLDEKFIFIASENITLVARFEKTKPEAIDLGLPSGTKWANMNVGASTPEDYGGYYAWGETEEKDNYSWSTYKWCKGSYDSMTKYCDNSDYGTVDYKTTLDPQDDVAHVKWGGTWRMPTKAEQDELRNNCTWTWTTQNGVNGYKVTGPNGNSIFLPAAGYRIGTGVGDNRGSSGYYWSSSLYSNVSDYAFYLEFFSDGHGWDYYYRYRGRSVRPVSK